MPGQTTVYLIRHGEKPPSDAPNPNILSEQGVERSKALVQVFGSNSQYNIGHIMAEHPKKGGGDQRPYDTIRPLADSLGLEVDISVKRDDTGDVGDAVRSYTGTGNFLVCWEHHHLHDIAQAIGVADAPEYPDDRFDVIWTIPPPYNAITSKTSEDTPNDTGLPAP